MTNLNARAWLALAVLAFVMGVLLFAAGTVHYWQAWVYLSIFTGASVLTTHYLMRNDPALLERRMRGGSDGGEATHSEIHHAVYVMLDRKQEPELAQIRIDHLANHVLSYALDVIAEGDFLIGQGQPPGSQVAACPILPAARFARGWS